MHGIDNRHVAVGVDAALTCLPAVRVAARQAAARGVPLYLVHALSPRALLGAGQRPDPNVTAARVALEEAPGLTVRRSTVPGAVEFTMRTEATRASVLVIGSRGHGARVGRLTGSLGLRLAGRTACPLLIVRRLGNAAGPVVVGVDDPPASDVVLAEAFRQARLLRRRLQVVHAWQARVPVLTGPPATYGHELFEMFQEEAVAGETERIGADFPDVEVCAEVREGRDRPTLIAAAEGAALLVVGGQREPGAAGWVLGSTAITAAQHAPCPVLVVADSVR
jgi:nucleotide-binding universal stress UspA family protein